MFFFFNDTATTEIYTLSLHDALPICARADVWRLTSSAMDSTIVYGACSNDRGSASRGSCAACSSRSEEHTSELQSQSNLVCRLLLEKKKKRVGPHAFQQHLHHSVACN